MLKYLNNISQKLYGLKTGMEKNIDKWERMPEKPEYVQAVIDEINIKNSEINELREKLSQKYMEARKLRAEKINIITMLQKRAIGIHAEEPGKLNDYGINKKL